MSHKVGIYVRVSTEEQAQVADGSIDSQQHRIKSYIDIKLHQDKNWGKVIETYIDDGYSAGSTNRPAYQRLIRDLKIGKISLILVADLSRLSRNISDFSHFYNEIGKYKASFLSIKEQFDTSTPIGEMMVFNMINLAQFERKQTSERISMNFHSRAMRGLANGGRPLLGYDSDPTNPGKKIVNEAEAELVKRIFEMYDEGLSLSSIADQLTQEKIKRKETPATRTRHVQEGRWTIDCVQNILKNHSYIGIRVVNAKNREEDPSRLKAWQQYHLVPASWLPIIDEKTFSKVQRRLEEAHILERKRFHSGERRPFLMSGIIKCGHCGRALSGQSAHGNTHIHRYYGHKQLIGEKVTCPIKRFPADEIEEAVIQHLDKILSGPGYLDQINDNIEQSYGASRSASKLKKETLAKTIAKVDSEIESVFKLVTTMKDGSAGAELIQEKLQKLAEKKKVLEQELDLALQFEQESSVMSGAKKFIETNVKAAKAAFKKAKPHLQKKLLGGVFQQLVATDLGLGVHYTLSEEMSLIGKQVQMKKPSEVISDGFSYLMQQTLGFFVSQSSPIVGYGGPLLSLVEPQRFIITRVYLTHYCKAKTDFVLLANKRWLGGESIKSLAQFFGLKEQTVKGYLWKLKNEPRFKTFYQQGTKE